MTDSLKAKAFSTQASSTKNDVDEITNLVATQQKRKTVPIGLGLEPYTNPRLFSSNSQTWLSPETRPFIDYADMQNNVWKAKMMLSGKWKKKINTKWSKSWKFK